MALLVQHETGSDVSMLLPLRAWGETATPPCGLPAISENKFLVDFNSGQRFVQ